MQGMGRTLFERLHGLYGDDVSQMLTVQYRMHEDIMSWASAALYHNLLAAHPSVAHHTLPDLPVSGMLLPTFTCCHMWFLLQACCSFPSGVLSHPQQQILKTFCPATACMAFCAVAQVWQPRASVMHG